MPETTGHHHPENGVVLLRQPIRWNLGDGDRIFIHGKEYRFVENHAHGYILAPADKPDEHIPFSWEALDEIERGGRFRHERKGASLVRARAELQGGAKTVRDVPEPERALMRWKREVIVRYVALENSGAVRKSDAGVNEALKLVAQQIKDDTPKPKRAGQLMPPDYKLPSPRRLREWIQLYTESGEDLMSLRTKYCNCGPRGSTLNVFALGILVQHARMALSPEKPTTAGIYRKMKIAFKDVNAERRRRGEQDLKIPDEDTLGNLINTFAAYDVVVAQDGEEIANNRFRNVNDGPIKVGLPFERIEIDAWRVHLHTLVMLAGFWDDLSPEMQAELAQQAKAKDKHRMALAVAIDCASRVYPGVCLTVEPNAAATLKVIRQLFMDKTPIAIAAGSVTPWEYRGRPKQIVFDAGSENIAEPVITALDTLRIPHNASIGGAPSARGTVERGHHTIDQKLISIFAGRTWKDAATRKKYAALARGCVHVNEVARLVVRFLVDDYHNDPHSGLGGLPPRLGWLDLTASRSIDPPPNTDEIRIAMGTKTTATLGPTGVTCCGYNYRSARLQKLFEQLGPAEVEMIYDEEDVSAVSVKMGNDWLTVPGPKAIFGMSKAAAGEYAAIVKRRGREMADLTEDIRDNARREVFKLDELSRARMGILAGPVTEEEIERARRRMSAGVYYDVEFGDDEAPPPDLLGDAVKVGTAPAKPRGSMSTAGQAGVMPQPVRMPKPRKLARPTGEPAADETAATAPEPVKRHQTAKPAETAGPPKQRRLARPVDDAPHTPSTKPRAPARRPTSKEDKS